MSKKFQECLTVHLQIKDSIATLKTNRPLCKQPNAELRIGYDSFSGEYVVNNYVLHIFYPQALSQGNKISTVINQQCEKNRSTK